MKKLFFSIALIISIVGTGSYVTEATEIQYGYIDIKAITPENFDTSIMINFTLEDGTNALYTLEKVNSYKNEEKMLIGKHKLEFISIYNDLKGRYSVENEKEITITKDTSTPFVITITDAKVDNKKTLDKETDMFLGIKTEEKVKEDKKEKIENVQEIEKADKGIEKTDDKSVSNEKINKKVENKESKGFLRKYMITIIIAVILALIIGVIKFKQLLYKD